MSVKGSIRHVSECFVKPFTSDGGQRSIPLSPLDNLLLSLNYIQRGLLFSKPTSPSFSISAFLSDLKYSLSIALVHFYPLAGRLSSALTHDPPSTFVSLNCTNSGARFIHAILDFSVDDVLSPAYVPDFVSSFFDHNHVVNHDGHYEPLLSLQVTELIDGVFVGCSMNHSVGDGTSFWLFFSSLSEIFKARKLNNELPNISLPLFDRSLLNLAGGGYGLPYTHPQQFIRPSKPHTTKERFFHFNTESIVRLKAAINSDQNTVAISSLQAVSALMWKSLTRARKVPSDESTACMLACSCRPRMEPRVPDNYFGNCVTVLRAWANAGELLENSVGWAAARIHRAVVEHDAKKVKSEVELLIKSPVVHDSERLFPPYCVMLGSSPRFGMYGVDFGFGKARAIRTGFGNKFDGKIFLYPGREGGGGIDLEVCLLPEALSALESDSEFNGYLRPLD